MHFDVIIGNPPYQMNVGVEKENYAVPIYQKFVLQSMKLMPRYLIMIIPARWYAGGRGLDDFRDMMLHDKRISHISDFPDAGYCFPGVDIAGGVCYFKWERNKIQEDCTIITFDRNGMKSMMSRPLLEEGCDTLIRFNEAIPILRKIQKLAEPSFAELVSPQTPFGFVSSFTDYRSKPFPDAIKIYTSNGIGYVKREQIGKGIYLVDKYKVYISKAYGERGAYPYFFLGKPFLGEDKSCCTQTYLCIGPFHSKIVCENVMSYIRTRFFRFCVMLRRNTQDAMRQVYSFVPLQDFSKSWTDAELYKKYKLMKGEIEFIESMIKPME